jgi:hypothetical protein
VAESKNSAGRWGEVGLKTWRLKYQKVKVLLCTLLCTVLYAVLYAVLYTVLYTVLYAVLYAVL